jgi:stage III sporulation protein AB
MMTLIGATLVLIAGTLIGFQQAARFADRPKQLRQLAHALQRLETEIGYGYTPLPEAIIRTADTQPEPVASMLRRAVSHLESGSGLTFRESWERAVRECWRNTAMRSGEQNVLIRLGSTLGISDKEDQIKHLRLALMQLKSEEEAARDDQARYEKMCKSLGILAAALIVILMV